jgi:hypothetical protein
MKLGKFISMTCYFIARVDTVVFFSDYGLMPQSSTISYGCTLLL